MNWLIGMRGILPGREFFSSGLFWVPATIIVAIVLGVVCLLFWGQVNSAIEIRTEELETGIKTIRTETVESNSSTIRNVGLVVGGIVAVMLAMWRSLVAERQADATLRQASAAFLQAKTAERQSTTALWSFLNERHEQGGSKLGSDNPTVRMEGIDMLERLAREHPSEYHVQTMRLLCAFIRHPTKDANIPEQPEDAKTFTLREDVQAAIKVVGRRSETQLGLEAKGGYYIDLAQRRPQRRESTRIGSLYAKPRCAYYHVDEYGLFQPTNANRLECSKTARS